MSFFKKCIEPWGEKSHDRSKVWGHPDKFEFSMKMYTFIYQINCKNNRKYSQDIDKVRNNDCYCKY